ncbi:ULK kinase [Fusarium pseudoanthophilum]|uniref:ULK kinase n=1 Tax=Fusarium pseudoanthophilum TaxID=48495 RepID=A0A8H5K977_9HYPO|nr:ULK kinase [Fusarium pseudoanthophilum]
MPIYPLGSLEGCTLTEKESVSAFEQILMGLIQLKRKRTPETFQIVLADFGIAGKYTEQSEYFYGTAYYKASEIFDETADVVDDRSDVWSTGIIVLEKMSRIKLWRRYALRMRWWKSWVKWVDGLHGFPNSQVGTSGQTITRSVVALDRQSDLSIFSRLPGAGLDTRPRPEVFLGCPGDIIAGGAYNGEAPVTMPSGTTVPDLVLGFCCVLLEVSVPVPETV